LGIEKRPSEVDGRFVCASFPFEINAPPLAQGCCALTNGLT
jgi:hypothetical protein